ncbi:TPA: glycosyltransferase family 2 protein [Vibrio alginolyticus]
MENKDVKVSIITPCYNAQDSIVETIESVLNQTFVDWELIVVDDCSSDDTVDILRKYAERDNRINLIELSENSGSPIKPRNVALQKVQGEFVCFLDADDIWYSEKLEVQVKYMEENGCLFSFMPYDIKSKNEELTLTTYYPSKHIDYKSLLHLNVIGCLTVAIKREAIVDEYFKDIKVEDFEYWLRILKKNNCIAHCCSEFSYSCYNVVENSRSSNKVNLIDGYWNVIKNYSDNRIKAFFTFLRYSVNYFFKYR